MDSNSVKERVDDLGDVVRRETDQAKQKLGRLNGWLKSLIQDHPGACLLSAVAAGFLVARLVRHRQ